MSDHAEHCHCLLDSHLWQVSQQRFRVHTLCVLLLLPWLSVVLCHITKHTTAATVRCSVQFLKVWGAADATCERWYAAGCRTLDDLRARTDLTEQQVSLSSHAVPLYCVVCHV